MVTIAEHIKVPELRFTEFSGDWQEKRLGEVTSKTGKRNRSGLDLPIYSINNKIGFNPQADEFDGLDSNERGYDTTAYKIIEKNTFAYNPARINVGSIGFSGELSGIIISSLYVCFQTSSELSDEFVWYFFRGNAFHQEVLRKSEGGVRMYLFYENFSSIRLAYPTLPEQQKIAEFLTAVDEKIGKLKRKKDLLEAYKKGAMQKLFSQEIRFKDDQGNPYPDWEEKRLGEVANCYQPKTLSQEDLSGSGFPVYGANGLIGYHFEYNHEYQEVTVTCRGSTCGEVSLIPSRSWITGNAMVVTPKTIYLDKRFLFYALDISRLEYLITGSGQPQITSDIKTHKLTIPGNPEQQKIAEFLTGIDDKIKAVANQIDQAAEFKKGLLQKMFV